MNLIISNHSYHYEMENLLRVFFPDSKIDVTNEKTGEIPFVFTSLEGLDGGARISLELCFENESRKKEQEFFVADKFKDEAHDSFFERKMALVLFEALKELTGYTPPWGILTGVRPAKLMTKLCRDYGEETARRYFLNELLVSEEKTSLAMLVAENESEIVSSGCEKSFSLYISIPFCPTRCSYCSFVSHSNESAKKLIPSYVELLCRELQYTAEIAKRLSLVLESVYMGGGTPTALEADELKKITDTISKNFNISPECEYTIEAGRPDSVTKAKLEVIKNCGATRISINPQTFNDKVLEVIGRKHTSKQTAQALEMARAEHFDNINMDLIAGLPEDSFESYKATMEKTLSFSPENITVHTLALKRSSTLVTEGRERGSAEQAQKMLSYTFETLTNEGYIPYYMYRQSRCLGNLENVGWAKRGYKCRYNIYMMEETHTVLAVGAGAVTKLRSPKTGEIERIFNYKYPYEYINSFDEILNRKNKIELFYNR